MYLWLYYVAVGPPFGGLMYELFGKEVPFLILAFLAVFDGSEQKAQTNEMHDVTP